jgi:putative SOS response-associated peptidase YedK
MCGRFVQQYAGDIPARFGASAPAATQLELTPRYNVAPTQQIPVVVEPDKGARRVEPARWGLTPRFGNTSLVLFNARVETLPEKASFRRLLPHRRCLVPADGFYEWEKVGGAKLPWLYRLKGAEPFAFAGLYDVWTEPDGREMTACTILTTAPNELVLPVHDRMPVILPRDLEDDWLDPDLDDPHGLLPLLGPYPAGAMERIAVSKLVNNSRLDDPRLIEPVAA